MGLTSWRIFQILTTKRNRTGKGRASRPENGEFCRQKITESRGGDRTGADVKQIDEPKGAPTDQKVPEGKKVSKEKKAP